MLARDITKIYSELGKIKEKRLPIKLSFVLSRNINKLESVNEDVEKTRADLIRKFAEKDENGNVIEGDNGTVKISAENVDSYIAELDTVLDTDIDITFDKISMTDIEKCDGDGYDKLTVGEIGAMDQMIENDET